MSLCPSEGWCHLKQTRLRLWTGRVVSAEGMFWFPCLPLCVFFLSCSSLGECGLVALVSPLPPSSVCLMLSDWRDGLGDGSVLLPVGLRDAWT